MTAADAAVDAGFAPAKVNLFLHLRGRRGDGYHLLESLVVFAGVGDRIAAEPAPGLSLAISGPFAEGLDQEDNLCLRAADALSRYHEIGQGVALSLTKSLPVAAGIGGGSADAAATLRVLSRLWQVPVPDGLALGLGADVPVCLDAPAPRMMSGIGDVLGPAPPLPACWLLLVNPGVGVATGEVFANVADPEPAPGPRLPAGGVADFDDLRDWLARQRNDLEAPARALCSPIDEVLAALSDAPLARMSGSGATCFALFAEEAAARAMASRLSVKPDWWVTVAPVLRAR